MINEYKYVNGKVVAIDDKTGLKEYDYQDNIDELLKQENIIEYISDSIKSLNIVKTYHDEIKEVHESKKFYKNWPFIFDADYGSKIGIFYVLYVFCGFTIMSLNLGANLSSFIISTCRIIMQISLVALIPTIIYQYKKFIKDNDIKLFSIDIQIQELERELQKEKKKLIELQEDKTKTDEDIRGINSVNYIDNDKNETINNVKRKNEFYEYYRDNCSNIRKMMKNSNSNNIDNSIYDSEKKSNKSLSRRKIK